MKYSLISTKLTAKPEITEEGFTIVDAIIGILIASIFLLVSLQAIVLATYFRVAAQRTSEGILLIQQDLEEIRYLATTTNLPYNPDFCNPTDTTNGYAQALIDSLATPPNPQKINNLEYVLNRTTTVATDIPYHILQLTYQVRAADDGDEVAKIYTEVIPDAAFECN